MLESIKNLFTKNEHLVGEILLGEEVIGTAIADLTYNEFDTNRMEARITEVSVDEKYPFIFFQFGLTKKIYFRVTFEGYEKRFALFGFSHHYTGVDTKMTGRIDELITIQKFPPPQDPKKLEGPNKVNIKYEFPSIKFSQHTRGGTKHIHRGFFYGSPSPGMDWLDPEMPSKWNDDVITFFYKEKKIMLYDGMYFESESKDKIGYPTLLGIHKTILSIEEQFEENDIIKIHNEIRRIANCISICLSLFENNRINWHKEEISLYKGDWIVENNINLRWCSPFEEADFAGSPTFHKVKEYREFYPIMVKAILQLSGNNSLVFDEIFHSFILACIPAHYELSIIYYHSCLELLRKALKYDRYKFQRGIVDGCERDGIDLFDLFSDVEINNIKVKGKRFRFTEIRDSYLHEGLSMNRFDDVFQVRSKMRALCERLILQYLGINYANSPMGKDRGF